MILLVPAGYSWDSYRTEFCYNSSNAFAIHSLSIHLILVQSRDRRWRFQSLVESLWEIYRVPYPVT